MDSAAYAERYWLLDARYSKDSFRSGNQKPVPSIQPYSLPERKMAINSQIPMNAAVRNTMMPIMEMP